MYVYVYVRVYVCEQYLCQEVHKMTKSRIMSLGCLQDCKTTGKTLLAPHWMIGKYFLFSFKIFISGTISVFISYCGAVCFFCYILCLGNTNRQIVYSPCRAVREYC